MKTMEEFLKEARMAMAKGIGSNDAYWSVQETKALPSSELKGKRFYFLGSSVTIGFASENEAVADFLAKRNSCVCVKDAISGTTLRQGKAGDDSYVSRLQSGKILSFEEPIDGFICQLSTNDAWDLAQYGNLVPSKKGDPSEFDPRTTLGAIYFIATFVRKKWHCPLYFYSGSYYEDLNGKNYALLVKYLLQIATQMDFSVIDLFSSPSFNAIPKDLYSYFMHDPIHPFKSGYRAWWTPAFEKTLRLKK
jgi:hypothetical protein